MSSHFGQLFRISTFGESHGPAIGVVIDGCPPGLPITPELIQTQLDRRRPGQSAIVTQRQEPDRVEILSGIAREHTTGAPIALLVRNQEFRSRDYEDLREKYRPSHADFTYDAKYGHRSWAGGGRASARETIGRVAAGAIAAHYLELHHQVEIVAWVDSVYDIVANVDPVILSRENVDSNIVRCPDPDAANQMVELVERVRKQGDSVGGIIKAIARNVPAGWGDPIFDKLEADLGKAMLSIPACKGFESGDGFASTRMYGSQSNDPFRSDDQETAYTTSNHSGGIQGGISNGMPILISAAFKPVSTILTEQETITTEFENTTIKGRGRHDPCVLPRAVPIVESMIALVLADAALRQKALR